MVRTAIILLLLCCCAGSYAAVYTYDYTPNCAKAYQAYLSLHPDEGRGYIVAEMKANPYNLMATYIADYEDCTLLLINCDPHEYEQRAGDGMNKGKRKSLVPLLQGRHLFSLGYCRYTVWRAIQSGH